MSNVQVEIANQHASFPVDDPRLEAAVHRVLADQGVGRGTVSIAVTDDATIQELNRRYLQHDYATDVLSFLLESGPDWLEGEIVVSADTATRSAPSYGWPASDELLLYVIHGVLHLVGFEDTTRDAAAVMRRRERHYLQLLGVQPPESAGLSRSADRDPESPGDVER